MKSGSDAMSLFLLDDLLNAYILYQPSGTWRLLLSPKIVYSCASKGLITRLQLPRRRNITNFFGHILLG